MTKWQMCNGEKKTTAAHTKAKAKTQAQTTSNVNWNHKRNTIASTFQVTSHTAHNRIFVTQKKQKRKKNKEEVVYWHTKKKAISAQATRSLDCDGKRFNEKIMWQPQIENGLVVGTAERSSHRKVLVEMIANWKLCSNVIFFLLVIVGVWVTFIRRPSSGIRSHHHGSMNAVIKIISIIILLNNSVFCFVHDRWRWVTTRCRCGLFGHDMRARYLCFSSGTLHNCWLQVKIVCSFNWIMFWNGILEPIAREETANAISKPKTYRPNHVVC